jgi:hypothetical protein
VYKPNRPLTHQAVLTAGKIAWLEKLLSDDVSYTFGHKHAFSDDVHSHT